MDAFDADVLIYAATMESPGSTAGPNAGLGSGVRALIEQASADGRPAGVGSLLLITEVLIKPRRMGWREEERALARLLNCLELQPVDQQVIDVATVLGVRYGLRSADAIHLATAVVAGASRFITGNRNDFPQTIEVIEIVYPDELLRRP